MSVQMVVAYRKWREMGQTPFDAAHNVANTHNVHFGHVVSVLGDTFKDDVEAWRAEA